MSGLNEPLSKLKTPKNSSEIARKLIENLFAGSNKSVSINKLAISVPYDIITKSYTVMGYRYKLKGKNSVVHITTTSDNKLMGLAYSPDTVYLQD